MSVRSSLLAILTMGPAYGFQLHSELRIRTAGRRTVNVGQIYSTLERLVHQGSVRPAGSTPDGLPLYGLTDAGLAEALAWLRGTDSDPPAAWNDMLDRVLIASSLPAIDLSALLADYRTTWQLRLDRSTNPDQPVGESGQDRLGAAAEVAQAQAALAWLDTVAVAVAVAAQHDSVDNVSSGRALHRDLSPVRPKRGRRPTAAP